MCGTFWILDEMTWNDPIWIGRSIDAEATWFNLESNNVHIEITDTD